MIRLQTHGFKISGPIDAIQTLKASIECALTLTVPIDKITGFRIDEVGHLVFCASSGRESSYPFPPTAEVLVQHVISYINSIDEDDLDKFGEEINGYEEEYAIGYELYMNDWSSEHHRIKDEDFYDVFAVKPIKIEWGK